MPYSDNFLDQALNGGSDPFITLMRVNVDGTHYYFANNTETVTSTVSGTSQVYQRSAFSIKLPEDNNDDNAPTATLDFEVADIQIVRTLRAAEKRILVDLWAVLASDFDSVEFGPANYESESFSVSASSVSLDLVAEPILDIRYPGDRFTPETFPQLWT